MISTARERYISLFFDIGAIGSSGRCRVGIRLTVGSGGDPVRGFDRDRRGELLPSIRLSPRA